MRGPQNRHEWKNGRHRAAAEPGLNNNASISISNAHTLFSIAHTYPFALYNSAIIHVLTSYPRLIGVLTQLAPSLIFSLSLMRLFHCATRGHPFKPAYPDSRINVRANSFPVRV